MFVNSYSNKYTMIGKIIFSHGHFSHPSSKKIQLLSKIAIDNKFIIQSNDYTKIMNPDDRVDFLLNSFQRHNGINILVGSSMGGYVSTVASQKIKPDGLFLLSPAFGLDGYLVQNHIPIAKKIEIIHGWNDDTIPVNNIIQFANKHKCSLHLLNDEHSLKNSFNEIGYLFTKFLENVKIYLS